MRPGTPKVEDIAGLATLLKTAGVDIGAEDLADALWLARHLGVIDRQQAEADRQTPDQTAVSIREEVIATDPDDEGTGVQLSLPARQRQTTAGSASPTGIPIKAPAAPALRIRLDLARALRPLRRFVPSPGRLEVDEAATVDQIADQHIWAPVLRPAPERWLEVALVVEDMRSLSLWHETIREVQTLLERQGAFRRVTTWRLKTFADQSPQLYANWQKPPRRPPIRLERLWDSAGRRLILVLSDGTSAAWQTGTLLPWLQTCGQRAPTTLIQLLPQRLWAQTALSQGTPVWLRALEPGMVTAKLISQVQWPVMQPLLGTQDITSPQWMKIPVVTLEANPLHQWAKMVAGGGDAPSIGFQFDLTMSSLAPAQPPALMDEPPSVRARLQRFRTTASLMAQKLAGLMSAAPVSPPIVDLIRQTLLPQAEPVHVAEVFMGGLMQVRNPDVSENDSAPDLAFDFAPGVRSVLADAVSKTATESVFDAVSRYIAERLGKNIRNFEALLRADLQGDPTAEEMVIPFAEIAAQTLERMGGEYAALAHQLATAPKLPLPPPLPDPDDWVPLLQTYTFREASLAFELVPDPPGDLQAFEFETASLRVQRQGNQAQITIQRQRQQGWQLLEDLGQGVDLAMVQIPAGSFVMGSPETEEGHRSNESPQHEVTIANAFLMAKTPITQAQWRAVATLPQMERELDPDPSRFKGDNRPVERVRWWDAVEFCARLSRHTGRDYRLPSEAEWEYACRARTTTPFHFGETITVEVANYNGNSTYGGAPKGVYRKETTEVGCFPANGFGLYDMHGNVWEWCQDGWHNNYEGAPEDDSVWLAYEPGTDNKRVLRGGSWFLNPANCRSAFRNRYAPDVDDFNVGFRVVCGGART